MSLTICMIRQLRTLQTQNTFWLFIVLLPSLAATQVLLRFAYSGGYARLAGGGGKWILRLGIFFMSNSCSERKKGWNLLSFLSIVSCGDVLRMTADDENAFPVWHAWDRKSVPSRWQSWSRKSLPTPLPGRKKEKAKQA